jgi:hypothetical protein
MEIGGDWYDAFRLPDQRLAVAARRRHGQGPAAAAGMGRVRNALRALALTDPGRPRCWPAWTACSARPNGGAGHHVAYLVIDPETGEGMAGNAGHLPPLLLEAGSAPRLDGAEAGTPLGWASPRKQHAFRMPPGSTACSIPTAWWRTGNRGLDAGLDELAAVAARADGGVEEGQGVGHPERLLRYLVEHMLAGHEQDDDVTVLVMHFGDDDDDLPAAQVAVAGATADPVKDYLKQIGKVRCSTPSRRSSWPSGSRRACSPRRSWPRAGEADPDDQRIDLEWIAEDGRRAKNHLLEANLRLVVSWPSATPAAACSSST